MAIDGLLLSLLLAVAMVALVPAAAAAAAGGGAPAGAAGGASSLWGRRGGSKGGRRPGAFMWSVFGFGVGLPDIRMPSAPIEVKLVTQRVLDPIHYGNFCGPSPEVRRPVLSNHHQQREARMVIPFNPPFVHADHAGGRLQAPVEPGGAGRKRRGEGIHAYMRNATR